MPGLRARIACPERAPRAHARSVPSECAPRPPSRPIIPALSVCVSRPRAWTSGGPRMARQVIKKLDFDHCRMTSGAACMHGLARLVETTHVVFAWGLRL